MTHPMSQLVDRACTAGYVLTDAGRKTLSHVRPEWLAEATEALELGVTPDQIATADHDGEPCFTSMAGEPAPAERVTHGVDALLRPVYGTAQLDDGVLTVGTYTDSTPACWPLQTNAGWARHTTIVGAAQTGTTSLLRSILLAARTARLQAQVIDVYDSSLRLLGYPTATSLTAAEIALAEQHDLILARRRAGDPQLALLVINDLHLFEAHLLKLLDPIARRAAQAGIAIVAGTRLLTLPTFGTTGATAAAAVRAALTQELVLLHTKEHTTAALAGFMSLPPIPTRFGNGEPTAGVGYLPRRNNLPFRAWLP